MAPHYDIPPGDSDFDNLLSQGWSKQEIQRYIPEINALSDEELRVLQTLCNISMFGPQEKVDREQAIRVLLNPYDTPKELLLSSLSNLKNIA